ncbi:Na+/H+-dicarboxylate symporter [Dysgonomonas sp. PFB1-18]|uniref:dicarboxylate/amino acid:cation symporter n=1 Tax=unclassified Dysgonomonas TaxID=2630389 RepID=UPI0024749156|nr:MULTISPECIES: dicarboxylate/amino acid:cation symporter [unclassified Dysgonomonas]MDH6309342.1 Na+/H+-dicarboxylate symporter [Dysgonomonas sp. PF1-14]MDH6339793.1 Na+/H+-dicarboxylate symporter [Dysgonomonas sp. PF1-16]MDH6381441.1 Na+/H+-dicarboxylate symporter [Dysgonomonas sp. PFB1-18]MDH6398656.1 Na+/H+-dicarboxylate symporter [Dysgonomonas sp. PF1-23]
MNVLKNYAFTLLLLCGILIGGVCGIVFGEEASVVKPVGDIFLNMMFVLIVPLVFFSVSSSVCNMKQSNMVGRVIGNIIFAFLLMAVVAAVVAYLFTLLYNPLGDVDRSQVMRELPQQPVRLLTSAEIFVNTFTVSDFQLLFTKSNLLPLIIFSVFFGLATAFSGEKAKPVADLLNAATNVIIKMMGIIMMAAPIGLGCYFADTVGKLGGQILSGYMHVFILYLLLTVFSFVVLNSLYVFLAGGKKGFIAFWKNMATPSLMAIATSSSAACIPVNIEASKRMGVPANIAETVIPLGTNIHKDGSVMAGIIKVIFLFSIFGHELTGSSNVFMIIGVALLVGAVMGAIPSGGMTGELLICSVFGFSPQLAGTLMIISTIVDIPATLLNSTGNVVSAVLVTRLTEGKDWIHKHLISDKT